MKSKFFKGFFLGAAVGGILTWLFATEKGRETRQKLAEKAGELKDDIADKVGEMKQRLNEDNNAGEEAKA